MIHQYLHVWQLQSPTAAHCVVLCNEKSWCQVLGSQTVSSSSSHHAVICQGTVVFGGKCQWPPWPVCTNPAKSVLPLITQDGMKPNQSANGDTFAYLLNIYIYITLYNCVCWMFIYSLLHHASACATFLTKNSQEGLRWNREHAGFHTGLWQSDRGFCDVWCQENVANLGERFIQSVASCEQSPSKHESCLIAFLSLNWGQLQEKFTVCDK